MSISDSDRIDAGEYALGFEDNADRRRFEAALIDDPELSQAVWSWEENFRPLSDALKPRAAPSRVWREISARLFGAEEKLQRKVRRAVAFWRDVAFLFMGASAIAAAVLVVVLARPDLVTGPTPEKQSWIAAIVQGDGTVALARLDDEGRLIAEPVSMQSDQRDAELWLVPASGQPHSLGVLKAAQRSQMSISDEMMDLVDGNAQFVVTAEPPGGSPSGLPTGERLGAGSLRRI